MMLSKIARRTTAKFLVFAWLCFFALTAGSAHAQVKLPAAGYINTVAGDGTAGYSGDAGLATSAEINFPFGLAVDSSRNIYIVDSDNSRIRKVTASTGDITTIAGTGTAGYSGDGGAATSAKLYYPSGVAVDSSGNIYIADTSNSRIRKVTASTGVISTIAGTGTAGYSGDGGAATSAKLNYPIGVALDISGNIYIADTNNGRIREVSASTGDITTVAGDGGADYGGDGGLATLATLYYPQGVAFDISGNMYIADTNNYCIRKVTASTSIITTIAGKCMYAGYNGDNGIATSAELYFPRSVALDSLGNIYIADEFNDRIRVVTALTGDISTLAGTGTAGYSGDGGAATSADLYEPWGVALDSSGNIYVADTANSRIRVVGTQLSTSIVYPAYQVTSVIYAPPGNKSQDGYTNTTTHGTTTTIGNSISDTTTLTFTEGFSVFGVGVSASESFGVSASASNSSAFQETYTNATGVANASQSTNPDAINHDQDLFLIWLNPQVTVMSNNSKPVSFSVSNQPTANGNTPAPDIVDITAIVMEANAAGVSTVPATFLNQQYNPATGQYTPGLAAICKNLKTAEYTAKTCTLADQCGCTPADFAPILALDPLLYYNGATKPISPYPSTASPLQANTSTDCGTLPIPSGANCRYVPVPSEPGSTVQEVVTLTGPDTQGGNSSPNSFSQLENTQTTQTYGTALGGSVGASIKVGGPGFSLTVANTLSWTNSQSTGTANGSGATLAVSLNSGTVGCGQDIPVYEDTVFHTFVFQQPAGNTSCTTAVAQPTFSPVAGTYTTAQTVTISDSASGVAIYYTTNGTTPTTSSTQYAGPITVSATETVKAIAVFPGYANSSIGSAAYTIQ
jgi:sugar lactone lactonase YvrE